MRAGAPAYGRNDGMGQGQWSLAGRTWSAAKAEGVVLGQVFTLDKEIGKGRMAQIGRTFPQDHLAIGGQAQPLRRVA